jgi:hypothetical protein
VSDQIHLQKTRLDVRPVSERANGNVAFEQRAWFSGADPAGSFARTIRPQRSIDRVECTQTVRTLRAHPTQLAVDTRDRAVDLVVFARLHRF